MSSMVISDGVLFVDELTTSSMDDDDDDEEDADTVRNNSMPLWNIVRQLCFSLSPPSMPVNYSPFTIYYYFYFYYERRALGQNEIAF